MKTPTLKDVLWVAQDGRCWICNAQMRRMTGNHNGSLTLDHLWPKKQYGAVGDIGTTMLAHRNCNGLRGHTLPTDDDIRTLIAIYRRIPSWWLEMATREAARQAENARAFTVRHAICATLARGCA